MTLQQLVTDIALPVLAPIGFRLVAAEEPQVFDNAYCVLASEQLRVRVLRERGVVFMDIGPVSEPGLWFDSAVLMEFLGLSHDAGFHDANSTRVLTGAAAFLLRFHVELASAFSAHRLSQTKRELEAIKEERANRLFGNP
jgi:hypothetical protein